MAMAWQSIKTVGSVLDLAIWLEKHGQQFYEEACAQVSNPDLRNLFTYLAGEEQKHCAIYKELAEQATGIPVDQDELFGEYGKFIELLIAELAENLKLENKLTTEALLEKALLFEKDTLLYFTEIRSLFAGQDLKAIDAICAEEKRHITRLLNYRRGEPQPGQDNRS